MVFGRHATPKKKELFYLLKFLPNLRSSWIFVESKLHPNLSKEPPPKRKLFILTSSSPPPRFVPALPPTLDVFKPLHHRGWTIINQCTTIQQKLPTSVRGSRSGPPSTVVLAQFWLVNLVVETIVGISPSLCLYGGGYHWLISHDFAGLPGRHFFSNRWNYEKVVGALLRFFRSVPGSWTCTTPFFPIKNLRFFHHDSLPKKEGSQHFHVKVYRDPEITNSNTAMFK